jgi:hypothetical protein
MRPCQLDKIFIVEQSAGAENDRRLPVRQDRLYRHAELLAGRALHDYVRCFPKSLDWQNHRMNAQAVQKLTMFARLANGDRGKNHPRDTPIELPCDPRTDRPQARNGDPQLSLLVVGQIKTLSSIRNHSSQPG